MSIPNLNMIEKVTSQLYSIIDITQIGTPAMAEIDHELSPILAELLTLGPKGEQHHCVRQLFDWLVHPQRTAEEFNYVLGPLGNYVGNIMCKHFKKYMHTHFFIPGVTTCVQDHNYLGRTAAEALAVRCPVLEGAWELSAWLVLWRLPDTGDHEAPSDRLISWILHMMVNGDICPNAYLQIELMSLLELTEFDKRHQTEGIEAIMAACSALSVDYLEGNYYKIFSAFKHAGLCNIKYRITLDGCLEYGEKLARELDTVQKAHLSRTLFDFSYHCGLKAAKYTEPRELKYLISLLKTISELAKSDLHKIELSAFSAYATADINFDSLVHAMFRMLMHSFKTCFRMPQLRSLTSTLIMDVLELELVSYSVVGENDVDMCLEDLSDTNWLIADVIGEDEYLLEREIYNRYGGRLRRIREKYGTFNNFYMIRLLLMRADVLRNIEKH